MKPQNNIKKTFSGQTKIQQVFTSLQKNTKFLFQKLVHVCAINYCLGNYNTLRIAQWIIAFSALSS